MKFIIPTPTNAQDANRQALRFTRAQGMAAAGYTMEADYILSSGVYYRVTSPEGAVYTADPLTGKCTCPDFEKHGDVCKHILFVNFVLQAEEARDNAQAEAHEAMMAGCELESTGTDPYAKY